MIGMGTPTSHNNIGRIATFLVYFVDRKPKRGGFVPNTPTRGRFCAGRCGQHRVVEGLPEADRATGLGEESVGIVDPALAGGFTLQALPLPPRPATRAEGYLIQSQIEGLSTRAALRLEDRRHELPSSANGHGNHARH